MDVSVILLVYNHERYLKKAIDSILNQKVKFDYEIIISDDLSTDSSRSIILEYKKKYPKKIKLLLRDKNVGPTKNHYDLLKKCKGKYIAQLEGDDYWISDKKLQSQYEILESTNYIGVAHSNIVVNSKDEKIGEYIPYKIKKELTIEDLIEKGMVFHTATIMFRNIFISNQDYSIIWKSHRMISDFTLAFILLDLGKILFVPVEMSAYRVNDNLSDSVSVKMKKNLVESYIKILEAYDFIDNWYGNKYNCKNLKILRTEEILRNYFLNNNISRRELNVFLKNIKFRLKLKAFFRTFNRGILYSIRKMVKR